MGIETALVLATVRCAAEDNAGTPAGETAGGDGRAAFAAFVAPVLLHYHGHFEIWAAAM